MKVEIVLLEACAPFELFKRSVEAIDKRLMKSGFPAPPALQDALFRAHLDLQRVLERSVDLLRPCLSSKDFWLIDEIEAYRGFLTEARVWLPEVLKGIGRDPAGSMRDLIQSNAKFDSKAMKCDHGCSFNPAAGSGAGRREEVGRSTSLQDLKYNR